ncbi:MAG TPA: aspartyl protease family protein [Fulvivirga sp.]|nr:aspartyl protease family protein [Fulvivirga sp.]
MKKSYYIVFILLLYAVAAHCQTLGFKFIDDQKQVRIPFELHSNLIVVPVILNNQLPLRFILDTGVRTTILTEKAYSDILDLEYNKKYIISGIGSENRDIEAYITNGVTLSMPGVKGMGHAMLVLEEDYLELRNYLGTEVHGILGYEVFSRFIVKIDYDNKVLILTTPEHFKPKRSYDEIPIIIEDTKPYIQTSITYNSGDSPIPVKLMIDSGASHGLLLDSKSDNSLYIPEKNLDCNLGRGLAGNLQGKIARIQNFKIGNRSWDDVLITFPTSSSLLDSIKRGDVFRNGSIGGEILSRFKVIFDFPGERIYLKKGKDFKKKFSYNISGINVKAKGSRLNSFEITEVRPGSSGDLAGFKKGDTILSINNVASKSLNLGHIIGMLNARENKRVSITVQRGGERYSATFRLHSQI